MTPGVTTESEKGAGSAGRRRPAGWWRPAVGVVALGLLLLPATAPAPQLSVLVLGTSSAGAAAHVAAAGGDVHHEIDVIDAVAASVPAAAISRLEARSLTVLPDVAAHLTNDGFADSPLHIQAVNPPADWSPTAGDGVSVALVDTGVADVDRLANRVIDGPDLSGEGDGLDRYGHGTFMAGLIAGGGVGLAPGARIVSVKVAGADGVTSMSRILEAIDFVVAHRDELTIEVLNLSFALDIPVHWTADPLSLAVEAAWASGITVVAAAGNDGSSVTSPGRHPVVLTVGATDIHGTATTADDTVPDWSGRGTVAGTEKPDLVAPGVSVVSLRAPGSTIDVAHPGARVGDDGFVGSGTSMSTAITSGAAALLAARYPEAGPDEVKAALVLSADAVSGSSAGALDVAGAELVDAPVTESRPGAGRMLGVRVDGWAGTRWSGTRWCGTRWSGTRWSYEDWAGTRWSGTRWSGTRWSGTRWSGTRWSEQDWSGTRWSAIGWEP